MIFEMFVTVVIKANIPTRIAFSVATEVDSRVIIDSSGAESLLGKGDLLLFANDILTRGQGCFISEEEMDAVIASVSNNKSTPHVKVEAPKVEHVEQTAQAVAQPNGIVNSLLQSVFKEIVQETASHIKTTGGINGFFKSAFSSR
jgi:S-DNA-T family DNA segregation ATPase FtsK/SpoIIIE